jgi:hypothetical protein
MEIKVIDLVLQIATLILGGGLGAAVLGYVRNRRKDSLDAYSDMHDKLAARLVHLENELSAERARCLTLQLKVAELEREVAVLRERQDKQK